jgi:beta-lactamase class D
MTIAVDFDGTIVEHEYPKIGKTKLFAFETLKELQKQNHKLILWTYRTGIYLDDAVNFCKSNGIEFFAVNANFPDENISESGKSRKIYADVYIDDRNIGGFLGWSKIWEILNKDSSNNIQIVSRLNELKSKNIFEKFRKFFKNHQIKTFLFVFTAIFFFSCQTKTKNKTEISLPKNTIVSEFQKIIDSSGVNGSILIFDFENNEFFSNDFKLAKTGHLPASTFKIPNSIIALETNVVVDDSTLFLWDGKQRRLSIWDKDMIFKEAFQISCVPCYQEIARKIGVKRMSEYLSKFDYGNMFVDSSNIDLFWLEGKSTINSFQQIEFLRKFYFSELSISVRTENIMKKIMLKDSTQNYILRGKTGWSVRQGNNNGWFVGYIEKQNKVYFFATNVEPESNFDMEKFAVVRIDLTLKAFKTLKIIN